MASIDLGLPTVTPRTAYIPILDSGLTNSATNAAFWWRIGDSLYVEGGFTLTGGGGAAEAVTVRIPLGLAIDNNKLSTGTAAANGTGPVLGAGVWFDSGNGWLFIYPTYATTTTVRFYMNTQVLAADQLANGDGIHYSFSVPIVGWS